MEKKISMKRCSKYNVHAQMSVFSAHTYMYVCLYTSVHVHISHAWHNYVHVYMCIFVCKIYILIAEILCLYNMSCIFLIRCIYLVDGRRCLMLCGESLPEGGHLGRSLNTMNSRVPVRKRREGRRESGGEKRERERGGERGRKGEEMRLRNSKVFSVFLYMMYAVDYI